MFACSRKCIVRTTLVTLVVLSGVLSIQCGGKRADTRAGGTSGSTGVRGNNNASIAFMKKTLATIAGRHNIQIDEFRVLKEEDLYISPARTMNGWTEFKKFAIEFACKPAAKTDTVWFDIGDLKFVGGTYSKRYEGLDCGEETENGVSFAVNRQKGVFALWYDPKWMANFEQSLQLLSLFKGALPDDPNVAIRALAGANPPAATTQESEGD